jgi:hypothetical protein
VRRDKKVRHDKKLRNDKTVAVRRSYQRKNLPIANSYWAIHNSINWQAGRCHRHRSDLAQSPRGGYTGCKTGNVHPTRQAEGMIGGLQMPAIQTWLAHDRGAIRIKSRHFC